MLTPTLQVGDIVVMDNLGSHHVEGVRERIEATGAQLWYLPPYGPDYHRAEAYPRSAAASNTDNTNGLFSRHGENERHDLICDHMR